MSRLRMGEILVAEGKIDEAQLKSALAHQRRWGKKLGDCLVELRFLSEIEIIQTLSRSLRLPMIDVTQIDSSKVSKELLNYISLAIARKNRIVPLAEKEIRRKKRLVIATSDPTNYSVFDEVQFKAGLPLLVMIAPDSDIDWFIRKYYMNEGDSLPQNYVSGISLIEPKEGEFSSPNHLETDPVSNIFFDEDFTGISQTYTNPGRSRKKDKDQDED